MIAVIDTETTGLDPATESIVELAVVPIKLLPGDVGLDAIWQIDAPRITTSLVKPTCPISYPAMGVHHITEDIARFGAGLDEALAASGIAAFNYLAAHNAEFDMGFLRAGKHGFDLDQSVICTWRCAKHIWPDAPGFANQTLRYWLGLNEELYENKAIMKMPPHRALPDAWVTAHILLRMLAERTPDQLVQLTKDPILLKTVGFGKHFNQPWSEVPIDYLRWIMKQDFDADTKHTALHWGMKHKERV